MALTLRLTTRYGRGGAVGPALLRTSCLGDWRGSTCAINNENRMQLVSLVTTRNKTWNDPRPFSTSSSPAPSQKDDEPDKHKIFSNSIVPGVALSGATAMAGFQVASGLSWALSMPVSGIPVSILLGMTVRHYAGDPYFSMSRPNDPTKQGITFATKAILQGGIVAVAAKLSFVELLTTGSTGIPVVLASVGAGCVAIPWMGRLAGLPNELSLLLTAGTSICGVTAITALAPAIQASHRSTAIAVANTVAFGTLGMLAYPYLFHYLLDGNSQQVGMILGVAIHDTSQVLGAAMSYRDTFDDEVALKVAAVTKLTRNLGLAVCIPLLTIQSHRHHEEQDKTTLTTGDDTKKKEDEVSNKDDTTATTMSGLLKFQKYVPPFLWAFLAMSTVRSGGDMIFLADNSHVGDGAQLYQGVMDFIGNDVSKYALGTAMAGVGLSTSASTLRGVGWRPFAVGGAGALVVGGTGFTVASFLI